MISVIVPTYNRLEMLRRLAEAIAEQSLDPALFELIIIDDGSTDGTVEYLQDFQKSANFAFRYFTQENQGPATARNLGISNSQGEFIAFTDDDCWPQSDWLETHLDFLNKNSCLAGCGGGISRIRDSAIGRYIDACGAMKHPVNEKKEAIYLVTANAVYRRDAIPADGFRSDIYWPGGEDPDLSFRVREEGGKLGVCTKAVIRHQHRDSFRGVYRMFFNHGRGKAANLQWEKHDVISPWNLFCKLSWRAWKLARSRDTQLTDKATFLWCGLLRALGFSRGFASELKSASRTDSLIRSELN